MSHSHRWEPDGVHLKVWGETSKAEIDEAISHIRNSPELPKLNYVIADYLDVEEFHVSDYDTLIIASHDHWIIKSNPHLKIALVGTRPDVLHAFSVYANSAVIKDDFKVQTFPDMKSAKRWAHGLAAMDNTLAAQIATLEKDHEAIDQLIDQPLNLAISMPCRGDDDDPCRAQIREIFGKYLIVSMRHFNDEHVIMHTIRYPRDLLEAHAIEHDKLLTMVRQAIEALNDNRPNLDKTIADISTAYRNHRDHLDAPFCEYVGGIPPPPPQLKKTRRSGRIKPGRPHIDRLAKADAGGTATGLVLPPN
jgi:hemerythrin